MKYIRLLAVGLAKLFLAHITLGVGWGTNHTNVGPAKRLLYSWTGQCRIYRFVLLLYKTGLDAEQGM